MSERESNLVKFAAGSILVAVGAFFLYVLIPFVFAVFSGKLGLYNFIDDIRVVFGIILLSFGLMVPIRDKIESLVIRRELSPKQELLQFWVVPAFVSSLVGLLSSVVVSVIWLKTMGVLDSVFVYVLTIGVIVLSAAVVGVSAWLAEVFSSDEDFLEAEPAEAGEQ